MGDDRGVERHRKHVQDQDAQRAVQHEAGGVHPRRGNHHLRVEEPRPRRLHEQHEQQGEQKLHRHPRGEHLPQPPGIGAAYLEGQIAADCRGDRSRDEGEHGHHSADCVPDSVVLDSELPEHDPGGEEADEHQQEHAQIQQHGIAGYAPAVLQISVAVTLLHGGSFSEYAEHGRTGA